MVKYYKIWINNGSTGLCLEQDSNSNPTITTGTWMQVRRKALRAVDISVRVTGVFLST